MRKPIIHARAIAYVHGAKNVFAPAILSVTSAYHTVMLGTRRYGVRVLGNISRLREMWGRGESESRNEALRRVPCAINNASCVGSQGKVIKEEVENNG